MPADFIPDSKFIPDPVEPAGKPVPAEPIQGTPDFVPDANFVSDEDKYGTIGQQAIAGLEGFAKGVAGPLATGAERLLGVKSEDMERRAEVNPLTHYGSELLGLAAPAIATAGTSALARAGIAAPEAVNAVRTLGEFTQAGLLSKVGKAASEASGATSAAAKLGVQFGVENAILGAGDELSKEIQGNPNSIQTAAMNVGLMGLLGGTTGAAFGKASDLWKAKFGPEAETFVKDLKGRLADHANGAVPAADAVTAELQSELGATKNALDSLTTAGSVHPKVLSEYEPAFRDFQKAFTERIGDETKISPSKVNSFINQIGKPAAESKLAKLQNYIEANDKLFKTIDKIHSDAEIQNPFERTNLTATKAILQDITPGMKFADQIQKHALNLAAEGASDSIGAIAGHATGIPGAGMLGAFISHHTLKPLMKTVMPTLIKPLMGAASSALGMRAGMEAVEAVIKGETLAANATKALFTSGREVIPESLVASNKDIDKLDKKIQELAEDPKALLEVGGETGHYLPDHATALAQTTSNAVNYLNAQRPKPLKIGPLDREIEPGVAEKNAYKRTLAIAQQPLTVLKHLKDGTLQVKDVQDLTTLYPAVYGKLKNKIYGSMIDHLTKDGEIPYRLRGGLSLFLATPLDSTFTPEAMQAAQATFLPPQAPQGQVSGKGKSSLKSSKIASLVQTPLQARAANKTSDK